MSASVASVSSTTSTVRSRGFISRALGTVISPVVECVDVDGVVRRLDVNDLVQRIDIDALLDKVNADRHLDRVDFNRHLERVDFQSVIERIDLKQVIEQSDVGAIIAQSSAGIFTPLFDTLRIQLVVMDLWCIRLARCGQIRKTPGRLPPAPAGAGVVVFDDDDEVPESRLDKAIAVQGRYTGIVSKLFTLVIDLFLYTLLLSITLVMVEVFLRLLVNRDIRLDGDYIGIIFGVGWYCYFWASVGMTSQTTGMAIAGVKVVNVNGAPVSVLRAAFRTLFLPLSIGLLPIIGIIGFCRRDGRMLHDLVACTGIVYKWNARMARLREKSLLHNDVVVQRDEEDEISDELYSSTHTH